MRLIDWFDYNIISEEIWKYYGKTGKWNEFLIMNQETYDFIKLHKYHASECEDFIDTDIGYNVIDTDHNIKHTLPIAICNILGFGCIEFK